MVDAFFSVMSFAKHLGTQRTLGLWFPNVSTQEVWLFINNATMKFDEIPTFTCSSPNLAQGIMVESFTCANRSGDSVSRPGVCHVATHDVSSAFDRVRLTERCHSSSAANIPRNEVSHQALRKHQSEESKLLAETNLT